LTFEEEFPSVVGLEDIHNFVDCHCAVHEHAREIMKKSCKDNQRIREAIEKCSHNKITPLVVDEAGEVMGGNIKMETWAESLLKELKL